ncbi:MAG TPA: hypothetical protein VK183_09895 [Flavobacterium sp.]|nr:hypothetical protein [Flavobacterium sp.]
MKRILIPLLLTALVTSCKKEEVAATPKVIYEDASKAAPAGDKKDTVDVRVADLPVQVEGSRYLMHPIGNARVTRSSGKFESSYTQDVSFSVSNYDRFEFTGYLKNLAFQHQDSTAFRKLTDKEVTIYTATYLSGLQTRKKAPAIVYTLADSDTNRDGRLDENDIKSLYISAADGTRFTKLSVDMQELIDWTFVESQERLYFRCAEDTNKNGQFDAKDIIHYHYCDMTKNWTTVAYDPIR